MQKFLRLFRKRLYHSRVSGNLFSHISALLCFSLIGLTVTGCGFHLRGPVQLAPALQQMYLQTSDPYGPLARGLTQFLKSSRVHLVSSPNQAKTILKIIKEDTGQQLLSVGGTQQTRQYNLILTVTFQITAPNGTELIPAQTVSETRTIPIQSNQTLAGSNEANNLYRQMRQAIIYDIMSRLSSSSVTEILVKKS